VLIQNTKMEIFLSQAKNHKSRVMKKKYIRKLTKTFIDEVTDGCFGETKIQKVYNLYYAGIKNE